MPPRTPSPRSVENGIHRFQEPFAPAPPDRRIWHFSAGKRRLSRQGGRNNPVFNREYLWEFGDPSAELNPRDSRIRKLRKVERVPAGNASFIPWLPRLHRLHRIPGVPI